jgi:hypothetical protein
MTSRCLCHRGKAPGIADARPLLDIFLAAEPEDLGSGTAGQSGASGIVSIQDGEVFPLLVLKNARLRVRVRLESAVAVEVIRRDVEHDGNFWTKGLDCLQLEARHFQNYYGVGFTVDQLTAGVPILPPTIAEATRRDNLLPAWWSWFFR